MDEGRADAELVAQKFVKGPRFSGDVFDATSAYPWVSGARIFRVLDRERNLTLVVAKKNNEPTPILLTNNKAAVSAFLSKQLNGKVADSERDKIVAQMVRMTLVGTGSVIATESLWAHESRAIGPWLRGREKDPAVLRKLCTGIHKEIRQNVWTMQFNVFRHDGGVDSVTISGLAVPFAVRDIKVDTVKPAGEFHFPLEG